MNNFKDSLSCSFLEFSRGYFENLTHLFSTIDLHAVEKFVLLLEEARNSNKRIFFIGNGGSAATASHFANDLGIGTRYTENPLKVLSLCDNQSLITAVGNDYGYEFIFSKQLVMHQFSNEILVCISASGNSPNIIEAADYAKKQGGVIVGLTGFDGGKLKKLSDISLHVPTNKGEYGPTEDVHMIFDHLIHAYLVTKNENRIPINSDTFQAASTLL